MLFPLKCVITLKWLYHFKVVNWLIPNKRNIYKPPFPMIIVLKQNIKHNQKQKFRGLRADGETR